MWKNLPLEKYNVSGPRYTSYPTALAFSEKQQESVLSKALSQENNKGLALYVHIPFCKTLCYYCGCHKIVTQKSNKKNKYLIALEKEIEKVSATTAQSRSITQIHFGGGTPTYLKIQELSYIVEKIYERFSVTNDKPVELAIEIDPRTTNKGDIKALRKSGFNRMSFGIQDFDPVVQKAINRIQDKEKTLTILNEARLAGVKSISVDLIYGLPKQNLLNFTETLKSIAEFRPERVSLFNYAHMPQSIKSQKLILSDWLPSSETKLHLLKLAIDILTEAGYHHIGMDHFALPGDELFNFQKNGQLRRNFQGYTTHTDGDVLGFGLSAISKVDNIYSQNEKDLVKYCSKINNHKLPFLRGYQLSIDDTIRADLIEKIMCVYTIDYDYFEHNYAIIFKEYFSKELNILKDFERDNLLTIERRKIKISKMGSLFVRNIAMVFDVYLNSEITNKEAENNRKRKNQIPVYSKAI